MNFKTFLTATFGGAVIGAGFGAALGAAAGATGSAILISAGYSGYNVTEAAKMGAIGEAIFDGSVAAVSYGLKSCGLFSRKSNEKSWLEISVTNVGSSVLGGLIGYGIMNNQTSGTIMSLAKTAATFAVGSSVTMMPATCAMVCLAVPIAAAITYCMQASHDEEEIHLTSASTALNLA